MTVVLLDYRGTSSSIKLALVRAGIEVVTFTGVDTLLAVAPIIWPPPALYLVATQHVTVFRRIRELARHTPVLCVTGPEDALTACRANEVSHAS